MAAGYTIAGAGAGGVALGVSVGAATAMAIPVVGCILLGGVFLAGVALACVAGLANKSFLDTTGDCNIDIINSCIFCISD